VASELCEDARLNHVTTLEIRFAPQLHQGAPLEAILEAALEGISGRAGLILCGLYGEDPAVLERLVAVGRQYSGVVGLDLAGGPLKTHSWKMEDYARAFQKAGEAGLGRTVHAGEGRPPEEIRTAILKLGADRIGHGTTLMDDKRVLELVLKSKVTIEACLTSNVHTGAIPRLEAHPLPRWLKAGVRVCVCSDNTLLSNTNVRLELGEALKIPGMTAQLLAHTIAFGHQGCFSS
jgi:adenosine deaminase